MSEVTEPAPVSDAPSYWKETRKPIYSAALVLPFILTYEAGLVILRSQVINGGDAILHNLGEPLLRMLGVEAGLGSVLALALCFIIWQITHKGSWTLQPQMLVGMFFESLGYAFLLFMLLGYFAQYLPHSTVADAAIRRIGPGVQDFVLYCGAGVYEELVFRVLLLGLLMLVFTKLFHMEHAYAAVWSVVVGAIIFSAFHHIGGQRFEWGVFTQRVVAGLYFSAIYFNRSFGLAAATHALYDILVGLQSPR